MTFCPIANSLWSQSVEETKTIRLLKPFATVTPHLLFAFLLLTKGTKQVRMTKCSSGAWNFCASQQPLGVFWIREGLIFVRRTHMLPRNSNSPGSWTRARLARCFKILWMRGRVFVPRSVRTALVKTKCANGRIQIGCPVLVICGRARGASDVWKKPLTRQYSNDEWSPVCGLNGKCKLCRGHVSKYLRRAVR